jgi:hypothetical protein
MKINKALIAGFVLALLIQFNLFTRAESDGKLKILVVASDKDKLYAKEIKALLDGNNCAISITDWAGASAESAKAFDLIIITGKDRRGANNEKIVLDYTTPVLAYGVYGCSYLGVLRLKNGHPYT